MRTCGFSRPPFAVFIIGVLAPPIWRFVPLCTALQDIFIGVFSYSFLSLPSVLGLSAAALHYLRLLDDFIPGNLFLPSDRQSSTCFLALIFATCV